LNLLVLLGDSDDEVGVAGDAGAVAAQDAVAAGSTQQLAPGDVVVLIQPQGDVARTQHRLERVFSSTEDGDGLGGGDDATFVGIGPLVFVVVFLLLFFVFVVVVVVVVVFFFFFFLLFLYFFFTSSQKGRIHQRDGKEEQQEGGDGDADRSGSGCGGGDDNNMMGRTEATIVVTTTFIMMSIEVVVAFVSIMIWRGGWWRRY